MDGRQGRRAWGSKEAACYGGSWDGRCGRWGIPGGLWGGRTVTWDQTPQGLGWLGGPVRTGPLPEVRGHAWGQLALRAGAPAPRPPTWKNSDPGLQGRRREPTCLLRGAAPQGRPSAELQTLVNLLCSHLGLGPASASHPLSRGPRALPEPGIKHRERRGTPGPAGGGGALDCLSTHCRPGPGVGSGAGELWPGSWGAGRGDDGTPGLGLWAQPWLGRGNSGPSTQRLAEARRAQSTEGPCAALRASSSPQALPPLAREIRCEAARLPSEAAEPLALGVSF